MRNLLLLLLLGIPALAFSQHRKKVYLDENNQPSTARKYREDEYAFNKLHLQFETDTATLFVKANRENRGRLSLDSVHLIRRSLEEAAGVNIDPSHILVINYYPGEDENNSSGTTDRALILRLHRQYLKRLYSLAALDQFSVYKDSTGLSRYRDLIQWYPDVRNTIEKTFFKWHYPGASVVVIHPNGNYYSYFGEYSQQQVFYFVRALDGFGQGVLHPDSLQLLRNDLEAATDVKIDPNRILVIDYHPGPDCNQSCCCEEKSLKTLYRDYYKKLYSIAPVLQFNIYSRPEGLEKYKNIVIWRPDVNNRVRDTFFAKHPLCGSTVIIRPDGTYQTIFGEHSRETNLKYVAELTNK
ncbi:MAG TPA: hypothetical protein PLO67_04980 [Saprospiraceae bacterium]|mgnify:FL=1|nr:hypothetical protein [Saprospiraceae bacterium]HPI05179.1 hypothetical protein [Saprospiraceae bacterium]